MEEIFPIAATPSSIIAGFRVLGVYSFNSDIFTDLYFMASYFADRSHPNSSKTLITELERGLTSTEENQTSGSQNVEESKNINVQTASQLEVYRVKRIGSTSLERELIIFINLLYLQDTRPYPKAEPRKGKQVGEKNVIQEF